MAGWPQSRPDGCPGRRRRRGADRPRRVRQRGRGGGQLRPRAQRPRALTSTRRAAVDGARQPSSPAGPNVAPPCSASSRQDCPTLPAGAFPEKKTGRFEPVPSRKKTVGPVWLGRPFPETKTGFPLE
eukprot:gene17545-biopygen9848